MKKNTIKQKMQIGTCSLILIFMVLCLVIFCTLSLTSAESDYKLAQKNLKNVQQYYKADGLGEEFKKTVNEKLIALYKQGGDEGQWKQQLKTAFGSAYDETNHSIYCTVEDGEDQLLQIRLQLNPFEDLTETGYQYKITSWQIQNKEEYDIEDDIPLWDGN